MMTTQEFNTLLHMAVERGNLDPQKTYVALTWWRRVFLPFELTDSDGWREHKTFLMLFGDERLRLGCYKLPLGFYVDEETNDVDKVVRRPLTLSKIIDSVEMLSYDNIGFVLCHSPLNSRTNINPAKTKIIKNYEGDVLLCLYIDDRDDGEMVDFESMKMEYIELIDGANEIGEYMDYGVWKPHKNDYNAHFRTDDTSCTHSSDEQYDRNPL